MFMPVDKDQVIRSGLRLLNEVGLDGLTLRRIASDLGVRAPTLYWHVKNKQELLDEMATTMLRDLLSQGLLADEPDTWQNRLRAIGNGLRRALLTYRDGAKVFSDTYFTDYTVMRVLETPLAILTDAGFSITDAAGGLRALHSYAIGFTIEQQAVEPLPGVRDPRYDRQRRLARLACHDCPLTASVEDTMFGEFDEQFDFGLRLIISGMTQLLPPDSRRADGF